MNRRTPFLLRTDSRLLEDVKQWARDERRSLNQQIEYLLREALVRSGKQVHSAETAQPAADASPTGSADPNDSTEAA